MKALLVRDGGHGLLSAEGDLSVSLARLKEVLEAFADVEIVVTGEEAIERVEMGGIDVVAFVSMAQIQNAEQLTRRWRDLRAVVLTRHLPASAELMSDGRVILMDKQLLTKQDALEDVFHSIRQ